MPADLHKREDVSPLMNKWDLWVSTHLTLILFVLVIVLFVLVMGLLCVILSMTASPVGTEQNLWYNQLERII